MFHCLTMENQAPFVNVPQYDITTNDYINNNNYINNDDNNNNIIINSRSNEMTAQTEALLLLQMSGSPTTSSSSSILKGFFQQASSNGDFDIPAVADDFYKEWGMEMSRAQDDLASVFRDLQEFVGIEDQNSIGNGGSGGGGSGGGDEVAKKARGRPRISGGSTESVIESKKATMNSDKVDELQVVDPKRAKRILANRQSAARSKERKARYLVELEHRIRALQLETTDLTTQLRIYQRDTSGLTAENAELKIRLQVMGQQAQLRGAQNEALKQEVERLKAIMGEMKTPIESNTSGGARNAMYSPMASPSIMNYSPQPSPSTMNCSPQPSPSTMQNMSYNPDASSPSIQNSNLFSFPNQLVPVLSPLPPLHTSHSTLSNRHFQRVVPEQNDSLGQLHSFENIINNRGLPSGVLKTEVNFTTQMVTP